MARSTSGETFDIHGGGLDLIFPHHENEIAQSEAAQRRAARAVWMHGGFLELEGAKMSKSLGNVVRLRDALAKVDPRRCALFFLSPTTGGRSPSRTRRSPTPRSAMEYFYETLQQVDERLGGRR